MKVISYKFRIMNPQEQKLPTLDRELLGIEYVFTDHNSLLHCFTKTEILVHDFTELKCN